jgi:hypothetical protein
VVRHIFQACPVWIYTQSNITSIKLNYWNILTEGNELSMDQFLTSLTMAFLTESMHGI